MIADKRTNAAGSANLLDVPAPPVAWAALWLELLGAALAASLSAWSFLSRLGADVVNRIINLERVETLAAAKCLDEAAHEELEALEKGAERLAHVDEEVLADVVGGPIFSLPD